MSKRKVLEVTTGQSEIAKKAFRILEKLVDENAIGGKDLSVRELLQATELTEEEYWPADQFLLQQGYTEGAGGRVRGSRWLTGRGVEFFERSISPSPAVQIGAIFQGPVESSEIQAIATAVNSSVQQVVKSTQPDDLRNAISRIVEDMVEAVKGELNVDELASYAQTAKDFREEIEKQNPDKSFLHRCLASLSFLGDFEGAIALGERALRLAELVLPYVPVLVGYLNQIYSWLMLGCPTSGLN